MTHHWQRVALAILPSLTAAALLSGCSSSGSTQNDPHTGKSTSRSSFAQCLKKHGVSLPGRPAGQQPSGAPPTGAPAGNGGQGIPGGSGGSAFRKAIQACGGPGNGGSGSGGFGGAP